MKQCSLSIDIGKTNSSSAVKFFDEKSSELILNENSRMTAVKNRSMNYLVDAAIRNAFVHYDNDLIISKICFPYSSIEPEETKSNLISECFKVLPNTNKEDILFVDEPICSYLYYSDKVVEDKSSNNIIIDVGGQTTKIFYINVFRIENDICYKIIHEKFYDFGGNAVTEEMVNHCINSTSEKYDSRAVAMIQESFDETKKNKLYSLCEEAKHRLSSEETTHITLEKFKNNQNLDINISRNELENISEHVIDDIVSCIEEFISVYKINFDDIHNVLFSGGALKMTMLFHKISRIFTSKSSRINILKAINPDEVVAMGCAYYSRRVHKIVEGSNVVEESLGIKTSLNYMSILIKKGQKFPIITRKFYFTTIDNQESIRFRIYRGEYCQIEKDTFIKTLTVDGIPPKPKGEICFEVIFHIESNGDFSVTIKERNFMNLNEKHHVGNIYLFQPSEDEVNVEEEKYQKEKMIKRIVINNKVNHYVKFGKIRPKEGDKLIRFMKNRYRSLNELRDLLKEVEVSANLAQ